MKVASSVPSADDQPTTMKELVAPACHPETVGVADPPFKDTPPAKAEFVAVRPVYVQVAVSSPWRDVSMVVTVEAAVQIP